MDGDMERVLAGWFHPHYNELLHQQRNLDAFTGGRVAQLSDELHVYDCGVDGLFALVLRSGN